MQILMGNLTNPHRGFRQPLWMISLQRHHNVRDCVSNHQSHDCLVDGLYRRRSKKTSRHWLRAGNSPVTGEFPTQIASNAKMFPFDDVLMVVASIRYYQRQTYMITNRKFRRKHGHSCSHCDDKMWLGATWPAHTHGHVRPKIMYLTRKRWLYDDVMVNSYI